jgi:hypothetical protein
MLADLIAFSLRSFAELQQQQLRPQGTSCLPRSFHGGSPALPALVSRSLQNFGNFGGFGNKGFGGKGFGGKVRSASVVTSTAAHPLRSPLCPIFIGLCQARFRRRCMLCLVRPFRPSRLPSLLACVSQFDDFGGKVRSASHASFMGSRSLALPSPVFSSTQGFGNKVLSAVLVPSTAADSVCLPVSLLFRRASAERCA